METWLNKAFTDIDDAFDRLAQEMCGEINRICGVIAMAYEEASDERG